MTYARASFEPLDSNFCMRTRDKHTHHPTYDLPFRLFQMAVRWREVAEVPSLGLFLVHSWLFGEQKTKAYVE